MVRPSRCGRRRKLHSRVHRRQSILPTTKENLWRPNQREPPVTVCWELPLRTTTTLPFAKKRFRRIEKTRPAYAARSPPQETDPSESVSCDRSRLFKNRLPMRNASWEASMSLRHKKCPSALSLEQMCPAPPVDTLTIFDCPAEPSLEFRSNFRRHVHRLLLRPHSQTSGFDGTTVGGFELPLGNRNPLPLVAPGCPEPLLSPG